MDLPRNATHKQIVEHVREAICTAYGWMPDDWEALRIAQNVADGVDRELAAFMRSRGGDLREIESSSLPDPTSSAPAEPELPGPLDRAAVVDIMRVSVRGNDVREWPADEIEFYRNGAWDDFADRDTRLTDIALGKAADEILDRMPAPHAVLRQWAGVDEQSVDMSDILMDDELIMALHESQVEDRRRVLSDAADVAPTPEVAQWLRDFAEKLH